MKKKRFSVEQITAVLQQAERRRPGRRCVSPGRDLRADVLPLEEGLRRHAPERSPRAEAAARGKCQVEAPRRRPVAGQGHAPGRRSKKVLKPIKQREVMQYLMGRYTVSARRACLRRARRRDRRCTTGAGRIRSRRCGSACASWRRRECGSGTGGCGCCCCGKAGRSAKSAFIACTPRKAWRCDGSGRGGTRRRCIGSSDGQRRRATTSGAWTSWPTSSPMAGAFAR